MRAAIYCRKSSEQAGDEAKSVRRQEAGARKFCGEKGWEVAAVYTDEAASGFLFAGRPEFQAMLRAARGGEFEHLVLFDLDRFGRNSRLVVETLDQLGDAGITVWDYSTGQAVDLDSFQGRLTTTLRAAFAQEEREKARKRTYAALLHRAQRGQVTGGRLYGYENVRVGDHVERRVNKSEARMIRDIYARFAAGESIHALVRRLNAGKHRMPERKGKVTGWSEKTVRQILRRPLYRGRFVFGRTRTRYGRELGKRRITNDKREREFAQLPTDPSTWTTVDVPALRIVDEATARRVDALFADRKARDVGGRPQKAPGSYLLTGGMLICPTCGGHFESRSGKFYQCSNRRRKGPAVCTNALRLPIREYDEAMLRAVEGAVLSPRAVEEMLASVDTSGGDERERLEADLAARRAEVERLVSSIKAGVPAATVAPAIRECEAEARRIQERLRAPRPAAPDVKRLRAALEQKTKEWRAVLRGEPRLARMLLRRMLGPVTMKQDGDDVDFRPVTPLTADRIDGLPEPERTWVRWSAQLKSAELGLPVQRRPSTSA